MQKQVDDSGYRNPLCYACIFGDATDPSNCAFICCDVRAKVTIVLVMEDIGTNYESFTPFSMQPLEKLKPAFANVAKLHAKWWGKQTEAEIGPAGANQANLWHSLQYGLGATLFKDKMKWLTKVNNPKKEMKHISTHSKGSWLRHLPKLNEKKYIDAIEKYLSVVNSNFVHVMGNTTPQTGTCIEIESQIIIFFLIFTDNFCFLFLSFFFCIIYSGSR